MRVCVTRGTGLLVQALGDDAERLGGERHVLVDQHDVRRVPAS